MELHSHHSATTTTDLSMNIAPNPCLAQQAKFKPQDSPPPQLSFIGFISLFGTVFTAIWKTIWMTAIYILTPALAVSPSLHRPSCARPVEPDSSPMMSPHAVWSEDTSLYIPEDTGESDSPPLCAGIPEPNGSNIVNKIM